MAIPKKYRVCRADKNSSGAKRERGGYHAGSGDFSKRRKFSAAGTAERRYGKGGDSGDWADIRYGAMRGTDGKVQAGPLGRGKPLAPCP